MDTLQRLFLQSFKIVLCAPAELKGLAADSLALLRAALYDARFPALFELELYGAIVGIFELNNLGELAETAGCSLALRLLLQAFAGSCLHDIAPCPFSLSGLRRLHSRDRRGFAS